jgi:hypothetical protein
MEVARHPEKSGPTKKHLRASDRLLANEYPFAIILWSPQSQHPAPSAVSFCLPELNSSMFPV